MSGDHRVTPRIDYQPLEVCEISPGKVAGSSKAAVSITVETYNDTGHHIGLCDRGGVPIVIPPSKLRDGSIKFVKRFEVAKDCEIDPKNTSLAYGLKSKERDVISKILRELGDEPNYIGYVFTITYTVKFEQLLNAQGILYLTELDLAINVIRDSIHPVPVIHPYSDPAFRFTLLEEDVDSSNIPKFNYSLYIIDKHQQIGALYTNLQGNVYQIPVANNNFLQDGVYICSSSAAKNITLEHRSLVECYTFEEAQEKKLVFRSISDAQHFGNAEENYQRELKEKTESIKLEQLRLQEEKVRLDKELMRFKHEIDLAQQELESINARVNHDRSREEMFMKDEYNRRSSKRKDQSEIIKYIPAMITGGFTIIIAVMKLRSG